MKILVADDIPENRLLLQILLKQMQHQVILACDGRQAVEAFLREEPDLVLMDIMMPEMNGLDAIRTIRTSSPERWVPIFVISALTDAEDVLDGLSAGADDYLQKPFNQAILTAKLKSVQRSVDMQRTLIADALQLKHYRDQNEAEQEFLQNIFDRLIKQNDLKDKHLQFWLQPAQRFSGDLICARRVGDQQVYFLLADSTGHGLAAALPNVLVNQAFQAMTKKCLPVPVIIREINRLLHGQMPPDRFVALTLGKIDGDRKSVEIWNGGLPPALALDERGRPLHAFQSRHPFAGILNDDAFDDSCEAWHWQDECELILYSDGLTEAHDVNDNLFGFERLLSTLATAVPGNLLAAVQNALGLHMGDRETLDDISCMVIRCM